MKRQTIRIGIVLAVGVFAALLVGLFLIGVVDGIERKLELRADAFFKLVSVGKYEMAHKEHTGDAFKSEHSAAVIKEYLSDCDLSGYAGVRTIEFKSTLLTARWNGVLLLKDDRVYPVSLAFLKERKKWKIIGLGLGLHR